MKKNCLYLCVLGCLIASCSSNSGSKVTDSEFANNSEVTLYYDIPKTIKLDMKEIGDGDYKAVGNNCVDILTEQASTDSNQIVSFEIKAKMFNCEGGKKVKVCLYENNEIIQENDTCVEFTVRTTANDEEFDTNHNLMFDMYETNTDKDKFADYKPGDCTSFCHDDADCEDFCDSAIGYRCSKRCTSDDQCIKYKDDDGNWIQMKCRKDGRCAYPSFVAVYDVEIDGAELTLGGHPVDDNATIDWGDGTDVQKIPADTMNNLSHTYQKKGQYYVEISGDYENWTSGCDNEEREEGGKTVVARVIDLYDILQFGPIGLGYVEEIKRGSFTNCQKFNKMSARDIPDSTKLTDMTMMFGGTRSNPWVNTVFDDPAVARWDTSNVTSMYETFCNSGIYHWSMNTGFRQDIGRWNVSKVTTTYGMFNSDYPFNANLQCWDMSKVKDISFMFVEALSFNHNLSSWDLHNVTAHNCVFRYENGHNGAISLKNYCMLRRRVNGGNIGRDGNDTVKGDCPGYYNKFKENQDDPYQSTCVRGYDYWYACEEDRWKELVNGCINDYLKHQDQHKHYTEDTVNCEILRHCKFAYETCQLCYDNDPACPSQKCNDYENLKDRCPKGKDTFCNPDEVFDSYYTSANSYPICHPCQHLDWSKKK